MANDTNTVTLLESIARAIWSIRREEEDRCDMELEDMGRSHSVWQEAGAVLAVLETNTGAAAPQDERALFESLAKSDSSGVSFERDADGDYLDMSAALLWRGWDLSRAALPAQAVAPVEPGVSDSMLACLFQLYDDALDKARAGRVFDNPAKAGSLEARAWDMGTERGRELAEEALAAPVQAVAPSDAVLDDAVRVAFASTNWTTHVAQHKHWFRKGYSTGWAAAPQAGVHAVPPASILEPLFRPLAGRDKNQRGYPHSDGWNDALLAAMDVIRAIAPIAAQPAAQPTDAQDSKRLDWLIACGDMVHVGRGVNALQICVTLTDAGEIDLGNERANSRAHIDAAMARTQAGGMAEQQAAQIPQAYLDAIARIDAFIARARAEQDGGTSAQGGAAS